VAGGTAGDWITGALGIPASEAEIGKWEWYKKNWMPRDSKKAFAIVRENMGWLEHIYAKVGNQIKLSAIGYSKTVNDKGEVTGFLKVNVSNHGLSDQIHDDFGLKINS
jgi:hypothetical protein